MPSFADVKESNQIILESLLTEGMEKRAVDAINDYTRYRMREKGFFRKILPPLPITNDELTPQVGTDQPVKVVEREPDAPAAVSVPFNALPENWYIKGVRYLVAFNRILSPRFTKDIDELRTYSMDIRQILADNAIKDMLAREDGQWIEVTNKAVGPKDAVHPLSGVVQWVTIRGGITRHNYIESLKVLRRTISRLETDTILVNFITALEFAKWHRDEVGGDYSEEVILHGLTARDSAFANFTNHKWLITIKTELVPEDVMYHYAEPKFLGKSYMLEDVTMNVERKAWILHYFMYELLGAAIGNTNAVARIDFE
ncbi:MAG: hypothetical protein QXH92_04345 [Candidatus Aenigmatarchaeota archaeon]